jgi:hypothetical protein
MASDTKVSETASALESLRDKLSDAELKAIARAFEVSKKELPTPTWGGIGTLVYFVAFVFCGLGVCDVIDYGFIPGAIFFAIVFLGSCYTWATSNTESVL